MAVLKCKMCGGDLAINEGMTTAECEYCGTTQTVPTVDDEKKMTLFNRANRLRFACEFDKAAGVYESIVADFPEEAEAYWGLVLCKFGIEYVDDPATGKKIPTCHRSSFDSIMDDSDFEMVMEYSDSIARGVYRSEAKAIETIRKGIIEVSSKEEPYDIFICYKETDENGGRTLDSVIAQDVYDALTEKGYRVFFSRITLEDKLGVEYEPYIFAALNSAKIMLAFGTDYEYYNAVWVKNEWSRFLQLIAAGQKKTLIPCYKNLDAYDMPKEFARLQAQDMGKVGAMQDLLRGIEKILPRNQVSVQAYVSEPIVKNPFSERGMMFLEDGDYVKAYEYFEKALDSNPRDSQAYLGKVLTMLKIPCVDDLSKKAIKLDTFKDYGRAMQFAEGAELVKLQQIYELSQKQAYLTQICNLIGKLGNKKTLEEKEQKAAEEGKRKIERDNKLIKLYQHSCDLMQEDTIPSLQEAYRGFASVYNTLGNYLSTKHYMDTCLSRIDQLKLLEKRREEEEKRRAEAAAREAERKAQRKVDLGREKESLTTELPTLKGLFAGKRRREIENRLAEIERELSRL